MSACCKTDLVPLVHVYRGKREGQRFVARICQGCGEAVIGECSLTSERWPQLLPVTMDDYRQLCEEDKARLVRATLEPIRASVLVEKAASASS